MKGEYGTTPAPVNAELQKKVLGNGAPITCRPADNIESEVESLTSELIDLAASKGIRLADDAIDDVLTYALFPQVGLKFLENRDDPSAFEPAPGTEALPVSVSAVTPAMAVASDAISTYTVRVNGKAFVVEVAEGGHVEGLQRVAAAGPGASPDALGAVTAALAGNIFKVLVTPGDVVSEGQTILVLEAMKMETDISAPSAGTVSEVFVAEGDAVAVGDALVAIA